MLISALFNDEIKACVSDAQIQPHHEQWVKRNTETGRFMDVKQNGTPFKGVRKER